MKIDPETVEHIAHLARIHIAKEEQPKYQHDLEQILTFMQQLSQIDTTNTPAMQSPNAQAANLRDDCVTQKNQRDQLQRGAPEVNAGFYTVPQVLSGKKD